MSIYSAFTAAIDSYLGLSPTAFFTIFALTVGAYLLVSSFFVSPDAAAAKSRSPPTPQQVEVPAEPVQLGDVTLEELKVSRAYSFVVSLLLQASSFLFFFPPDPQESRIGCISRRVKNKTAAPVQITAEQIIRKAREAQESSEIRPPKQKITDPEELSDYRLRKRKEFEDQIRRPDNKKACLKYALWEGSQGEFDRARSFWERALGADPRNHTLWLNYAEFEMKNRFINHARNVFDRAVTLLPRADQIWYSYVHMEETLGDVAGAR